MGPLAMFFHTYLYTFFIIYNTYIQNWTILCTTGDLLHHRWLSCFPATNCCIQHKVCTYFTPFRIKKSYPIVLVDLVHGSHLEQRIFAGTKWLAGNQVQASRFMAQVIVLVIINAMISNDWKIGIMEESKKSQYEYCLTVKKKRNFKGGWC